MGMIEKKLRRFFTAKGGQQAFDYLAKVLADQAKCEVLFSMISDQDMFINPSLEFGAISADSDQRWTPARRVTFITLADPKTDKGVPGHLIIVSSGLNLPAGSETIYTLDHNPNQSRHPAVRYFQESGFEAESTLTSYKPFAKAFAEVVKHANSTNYRVSFKQ